MKTVTVHEARANLDGLLEEASISREPIQILGERHNAVLVSEEAWSAVQETLYLLAVPGLRESVHEGLETPLEETSANPGW